MANKAQLSRQGGGAALVFGILLFAQSADAHVGHGLPEMWRVCETLELGEPCRFEDGQRSLYIGTCRSMSEHLVCVRNRPIQAAAPKSESTPWWLGAAVGLGAALIAFRRWTRTSS